MKRRNFIKLSLVTATSLIVPISSSASNTNLSQVTFDKDIYDANSDDKNAYDI